MTSVKHLPMAGCHNFRAVSGWKTPAGRAIAEGRLYRADGLDLLTDDDHRLIGSLNITHVFDLRASGEIGRAPSNWPSAHPVQRWQGAESAAEADMMALMARADLVDGAFHTAMCTVYARFPEDLAEAVQAIGAALVDPATDATLIHCAAGKDRTGFAVAMVMLAIGMREQDAIAEYMLSNACFDRARERFNVDGRLDAVEALAPGAVRALVGVDADYLSAALDRMRKDYGTIDAWLARRAGLDDTQRATLADRLLA